MAERLPSVAGPNWDGRLRPVDRPAAGSPGGTGRAGAPGTAGAFKQALVRELERGVRFSQHAEQRLRSSGIALNPEELERLRLAVDQAEAKGARESLVVMDRLALVVSVANRTVITAINGERMRDNVFTNIDSAVILGPPGRALNESQTGLDLLGGGPGARG
ncbi:MAG: hypothetical protein K6T75_05285 [Acetobacteraceae bacterium]|nr:hypothetical protein [Acetobacteraceae bacterium]